MQFTDTHCHIHSRDYLLPIDEVDIQSQSASVTRLICVGTDAADSARAVKFVQNRPGSWASVAVHPHDAKRGQAELDAVAALANKPKVVAIGECGLDYFYSHSSKKEQEIALRFQIELALSHDLPLIFHVREAFADFWPIFDSYKNIRGVVHSFTDTHATLDELIARGLYVGVNGIMTFTKNASQLEMAKAIPLQKLLLETDAPYLTPAPHRGTINVPAQVRRVAEFLADLRQEPLQQIADSTTQNALTLFKLTD